MAEPLIDGLPLAVLAGEAKRGAWIAGTLAALTTATFTVAVLTPPLSGPWCKGGCFSYPYAEIASRFPRDYYWMVLAIPVSVAFVAMLISVHRCTAERMKLFSLLGLVLGGSGAMILATDYWVQLAVIQPSLLKGEHEGIALLSQFNPHGLFIALEEFGYLLMSGGLACLAPVFWSARGPGRAIAWVFLTGFFLSLGSLVAISLTLGLQREYFFEVALISFVWLPTIVGAILLTVFFRRTRA